MLTVSFDSGAAQAALERLVGMGRTAQPVFAAIGENLLDITKTAFATSASPDGTPWAVNSAVTLARYLGVSQSNFKQNGDLSKKGLTASGAKKPLIGLSRDLSRQTHYTANADSVTLSNSSVYAAMQQFGGTRAQFPNLWGNIPARPFFPIMPNGELMPNVAVDIQQLFVDYVESLIA